MKVEEEEEEEEMAANMSMAEAFVSTFLELTQVTQLPVDMLDSPSIVGGGQEEGGGGGGGGGGIASVESPETPTMGSPFLSSNPGPITTPTVTPTTSPNSSTTLPSVAATRRELFPEASNVDPEEDAAYFEETILLDSSGLHASIAALHLDSGSAGKVEKTEQLLNKSSVRVSIPAEIQRLSDQMLREKLVLLGEQPGPITASTRLGYQTYLAKIQAGIQPAGTKGYKGE